VARPWLLVGLPEVVALVAYAAATTIRGTDPMSTGNEASTEEERAPMCGPASPAGRASS
jgi:hypothetical protein